MKILNCCLMEAEYNSIPDEVWEQKEEYRRFLPYIGQEKNVYDEAGLELTRRNLERMAGLTADVLFVTKENIRKEYQNLKAHGFSRIFQYVPEGEPAFMEALEDYMREEAAPDIILAGQESACWRTGTTGAAMANRLQWPYFCNVVDYHIENETEVWIKQNTEEEVITATIRIPAVLVMGEAPEVRLKTPKRKDKLPFLHQSPKKKEMAGEPEETGMELGRRRESRDCHFITAGMCRKLLEKQEGGMKL